MATSFTEPKLLVGDKLDPRSFGYRVVAATGAVSGEGHCSTPYSGTFGGARSSRSAIQTVILRLSEAKAEAEAAEAYCHLSS